jgi:hypothetical protein
MRKQRNRTGSSLAKPADQKTLPMQATQTPSKDPATTKGVAILARSLFREMRQQGYTEEQIIGLSTELIQLVNEDLQKRLAAE